MEVEPIRKKEDIKRFYDWLNENCTPREAECFLIGCNIALRAGDLLNLKFEDCRKSVLKIGDFMDFFGIGAAIKGVAQIYFRGARCTGRTINLFESVKAGDRVYFANADEANRFSRMCNDAAKSVECIVIPVNEPHKVFERCTSQGRAVFDHSWIEQFYLSAIEQCAKEIKHLETQTSGYGEAHRETRRKAFELSKWRI